MLSVVKPAEKASFHCEAYHCHAQRGQHECQPKAGKPPPKKVATESARKAPMILQRTMCNIGDPEHAQHQTQARRHDEQYWWFLLSPTRICSAKPGSVMLAKFSILSYQLPGRMAPPPSLEMLHLVPGLSLGMHVGRLCLLNCVEMRRFSGRSPEDGFPGRAREPEEQPLGTPCTSLLFLFSGFLDVFDGRHQLFRRYCLYVGSDQEIILRDMLCHAHEHWEHYLVVVPPGWSACRLGCRCSAPQGHQ